MLGSAYGAAWLCFIATLCHHTGVGLVLAASPPHIIFIVADDLGWNDVGFHGSLEVPTPNIDALAYSGVILNNYYVQPICTPSRSAIMSGRHPIHTGMQHTTISGSQPYGMPLNISTLPEYLNDLGYLSRAVGKWHLGFFNKEHTPTYRGFDSHYGYWSGRIDYYDHTANEDKVGTDGRDRHYPRFLQSVVEQANSVANLVNDSRFSSDPRTLVALGVCLPVM